MNAADQRQVGGDHYRRMDVQPWAALQAWLTPEQFRGYLIGSAIAYLARINAKVPGKGGNLDVDKALHYLEKAQQHAVQWAVQRAEAEDGTLESLADEDDTDDEPVRPCTIRVHAKGASLADVLETILSHVQEAMQADEADEDYLSDERPYARKDSKG